MNLPIRTNDKIHFKFILHFVQLQQRLKRPGDETENGPDGYEPPHKLQHNGSENLKFSVQIVQQLEFTTSTADSQPQQISTNVTVKALTNASVSTDGSQGNIQQQNGANHTGAGNNTGSGGNNNPGGPCNSNQQPSPASHDIGNLVECKQEPGHDYSDLDECAATVEKDFLDSESDTFKELISDLSDFHPGFLDFEEKALLDVKLEDGSPKLHDHNGHPNALLDGIGVKGGSPMTQFGPGGGFNDNQMNKLQHQQQPPQSQQRNQFNTANGGPNAAMSDSLPAAQTLKHMAEQHQHKNQMGMSFSRLPHPQHPGHQAINMRPGNGGGGGNGQGNANATAFTPDFGQFNNADFIQTPNGPSNNSVSFHKGGGPGGPPFDIKQEMLFTQQQQQQQMHQQQSEFDLKRLSQMPNSAKMNANAPYNKQQYSPYGSPGSMSSNHGSPGPNFIPTSRGVGGQGPQNAAGGPSRPTPTGQVPPGSGANANAQPGNNGPNSQSTTTLQMKQTQQLHISQQGPGNHGIQVSFSQIQLNIYPIRIIARTLPITRYVRARVLSGDRNNEHTR